MNAKDAVYYVGLIGGMIVGTLAARQLGIVDWLAGFGLPPGIGQLLCGIVVGVGCGYLAEQLYTNLGPGGPPPDGRS
jgi:hypothetical protein